MAGAEPGVDVPGWARGHHRRRWNVRAGEAVSRAVGPRRRWVIAGVGVALLAVGAIVAWPHLQVYAGTAPPPQFATPLDPALSPNHASAMGVAHNAGNNPDTTAAAIEHGAQVVEIDVISVRGQLVAGRVQPWRWLAERAFRGPTLAQAWDAAAAAPVVKLDLQQNDRALLDQLVAFLRQRPAPRRVMVSTRDGAALVYLRPRLPGAVLQLSTPSPDVVQRFRADPVLTDAVDGVSAFQGEVTPSLVAWAHQRDLIVLAWTVNDGRRLKELLAMGVDGITTQNLTVLDALARTP